eukprot:CAMPEP_0118956082 /NCGR_PEP_ID=MMETSP1169-20130426/61042_1 /TAXON_ID=36882 /ORGANISM="Pyramimonas obovata, Strain CCMP722" /LENGTH=332 /DNA_ID=CAMNT_0006904045 /DNA_START=132 /DNA_END=1127 /DNA_ORIENTATION=-
MAGVMQPSARLVRQPTARVRQGPTPVGIVRAKPSNKQTVRALLGKRPGNTSARFNRFVCRVGPAWVPPSDADPAMVKKLMEVMQAMQNGADPLAVRASLTDEERIAIEKIMDQMRDEMSKPKSAPTGTNTPPPKTPPPVDTLQDLQNYLQALRDTLEANSDKRLVDMDPSIFGYLEPIKLKRSGDLRVAESGLHGRGVYATADIPAGALLTWYPTRIVTRYRKGADGEWGYGTSANNNLPGASPIEATFTEETLNAYTYEMPDMQQEGRVLSFGNLPEDTANPLLLGHMLNDGAGDVLIPHRESADMAALAPAAMRYLEVAKEANNCAFEAA